MANTRASRKRQTQLAFTPLSASSPAKSSQPEAVRDRSAFIRIDESPSPRKKRRTVAESLPTPRASIEDSRPRETISSPTSRSTRSFMNGSGSSPMRTSSRPKRSTRRQQTITIDDSDSDEPIAPSSSPPRRAKRAVVDSDSDELAPRQTPSGPTMNANGVITFDDSGSDEPTMISSPSRPRRKAIQSRQAKKDGFVVNDDEEEADSDAEASSPVRKSRSARRSRRPRAALEEDSDAGESVPANEDDEEEVQLEDTSKRWRRDQKELESDLEFLGEADIDTPRRPASQKQSRQSALEALKQKRKQPDGQRGGIGVTPRSSRRVDDDTEEHPMPSDSSPEPSINKYADADADEMWTYEAGDEEDFIDDENQDPDEKVAMPFEFSQYKTMKPLELFKFAVEWMVQKKINPAFAITDEVYGIAFRRLDDYVTGLGSSKFQSSAWTAKFIKSLRGRPQLETAKIAASDLHNRCDACNRSGHPATYEVRFTGPTYNTNTLEEADEDEDSDEETTSDVPKSDTVYYIGKFCMRNSQQAHAFRHWKFHLNEWVVDYLKAKGELTTTKIVQRDGWSTKKRRKDAERIVDRMEREGEIKTLQRDFEAEISMAQTVNNDASNRMSSP